MSEVTAKLRDLLKVAATEPWEVGISIDVEYGPWPCFRLAEIHPADEAEVQATRRLIAAAPALARLVLKLSDALEGVTENVEHRNARQDSLDIAQDALAAAEKLKL